LQAVLVQRLNPDYSSSREFLSLLERLSC
jgi:hypothetical protein